MKNSIKEFIKKILEAFDPRKFFSFRYALKQKNIQIREERDKYLAEKEANRILSSYVFYLTSKYGVIRVPKSAISEALNKHEVTFYPEGEDYVIAIKNVCAPGAENACGSGEENACAPGEENVCGSGEENVCGSREENACGEAGKL